MFVGTLLSGRAFLVHQGTALGRLSEPIFLSSFNFDERFSN